MEQTSSCNLKIDETPKRGPTSEYLYFNPFRTDYLPASASHSPSLIHPKMPS